MSEKRKRKRKKSRFRLLHQYYSYTGFYTFVQESMKKAFWPISIFLLILWLIHEYVLNFNDLFVTITTTYNPLSILGIFFASESFLGLIPPEIFIAWSAKTATPILYLTILAALSYLGGIISFLIGRYLHKIPSVYNYLEVKMRKHIIMIRKWGGFLIIVGALLPIPFSMTSIAAGLIDYKFRNYLLFGLLRFVRFYLYALVIFNVF
jgi:membrane protein YqaA with SNARE-associated domain